jgi:hypothetical protein
MTPPATVARAIACVLAGALTCGCASSVELTAAPLAKRAPAKLTRAVLADPREFAGSPCFGEEVRRYLDSPGGLELARGRNPPDLTLTGSLTRLEVHSNRGDKQAALLYFTAFIITAPVAAVMYAVKDWRADAAAEGELIAAAPAGPVVWRKRLTVSLSERQRTMPTADALDSAMTGAVCQRLATSLLNSLSEHLADRPVAPR